MTHECDCGRPCHDTFICSFCEHQLVAALAGVWTYHGLAYDLDVALSRQAKFGQRHGSRGSEKPMMFSERASAAAHALRNELVTWARVIHTETGADLPDDTVPAIAAFIHHRIGWIRHHENAAEAHAGITSAVADVRYAIDRPKDTIYVGPCDCGAQLFAGLSSRYVWCADASHSGGPVGWNVAERVEWLLAQAEDVIATATQISAALTHYNRPVTPAAIRGYVRRGKLVPVWCSDPANTRTHRGGAAMYRLGDVLNIIAPAAVAEDVPTLLAV